MEEQEDDQDYTFKIILWLILFLVFGIIIIACKPKSKDYIMSVNGPVSLSQSGISLTHLATGMTIASHTGPEKPAFEQIEILKKNGVDPSAFIWVHAQQAPPGKNIEAAKSGAWISLDTGWGIF